VTRCAAMCGDERGDAIENPSQPLESGRGVSEWIGSMHRPVGVSSEAMSNLVAPKGVPSRQHVGIACVEPTVVMHSRGRHHGSRRQPKRAVRPRCAGAPNDVNRYRILVNENKVSRNGHRKPDIEAFTVSTQNPTGHDGARGASGSRVAGTPSFTWVNRIQLPELPRVAKRPPRWCHNQQVGLSRRVKGQVAVRIADEKQPEPASHFTMPGGFCMVAPPVSRVCFSGVCRS